MMKYILCSLLLLAGCSQTPSQFILAPGLQLSPADNMTASHINVTDQRGYQYLVTTTDGSGQTTLMSASTSPAQIIKNSLAAKLSNKKVNLNGVSYSVNIINLVIDVQQRALKFESNSKLTLEVVVASDSSTLTKTFNRNGNSYGPFSADSTALERDFNLLLGSMLDDIANDSELAALLTQ